MLVSYLFVVYVPLCVCLFVYMCACMHVRNVFAINCVLCVCVCVCAVCVCV